MKIFRLTSILAVAVIFFASCTKNPPSGPDGPTILDSTGGDGGGIPNGNGYGTLSVFLKYEPDCSEALRIDVFNESITYSETAYINDYYPFDVDCSYFGTADFDLPYGAYIVQVNQCSEYEIYYVDVYSDCELFTPQVSEGEYINATFFTSGTQNGVVTISINGGEVQRYMDAGSSYPDDCFGPGSARFNIPAGRHYVFYGNYSNPYANGQWMNFYYPCNVRQLNF